MELKSLLYQAEQGGKYKAYIGADTSRCIEPDKQVGSSLWLGCRAEHDLHTARSLLFP